MQAGFHLAFTTQAVVAFDITGDSRAVGFVAFAQGAALLITTPLAGVLADRSAKRLLIASELMLALSAVSLSTLIFAGAINIVFVAGGGLMLGVGISTFWPAVTASMGDATQPEQRATGAGPLPGRSSDHPLQRPFSGRRPTVLGNGRQRRHLSNRRPGLRHGFANR